MALTYRSVKGSALTIKELDDNFRHFTGSQTITGSIIADSFSGSFSGSFEGDGSNITGVTATLPAGVISSSAQIDALGFINSSVTASMSVATASYIEQAQSASYVITAQSASYVAGANVDGIVASATSAISATTALTSSFVSSSFEMLSPNGTRYAFTVNDSGHLLLTGSAV